MFNCTIIIYLSRALVFNLRHLKRSTSRLCKSYPNIRHISIQNPNPTYETLIMHLKALIKHLLPWPIKRSSGIDRSLLNDRSFLEGDWSFLDKNVFSLNPFYQNLISCLTKTRSGFNSHKKHHTSCTYVLKANPVKYIT